MSVKTAHVVNASAEEAASLPAWSLIFPTRLNVAPRLCVCGALGARPVRVCTGRS
ncbi:hypothetical protein ACH4F6_37010 [Streptomyces sp. NPDC017936]|uniref:hypothetical protein n=1 Tax=Streptomyces sp. NPDC017936 TaxID=3365016 RepID=UPI0037A6B1FA